MRLYSFRIQNFKSIRDSGDIKVSEADNVTILAGQNEAGKSSVLEALKFFEDGEFSELYRYDDTHPRVEVTYKLDDAEIKEVERIAGSELAKHVKVKNFKFVRGTLEGDDFGDLKYMYASAPKEMIDKIIEAQKGLEDEQKFKIGLFFDMRPEFIFYGSFSEDTLPSEVKKSQLSAVRAVADFEKVFNVDFSALLEVKNASQRKHKLNRLNERASDNLNTYWMQSIDGEQATYQFEIDLNIQEPTPANPALESSVTFMISQDSVNPPLYFEQKSKGFRWFSNFNLRLRAHQSVDADLSKFILLIDEPGEGLHEIAQQNAKAVLNELAGNGNQIIFSTHQAQMLREDDREIKLSRIKLITKTPEKGTEVQNITQRISQASFKDAMSPVRTAMGLVSVDATAFIQGKVQVVVEGVTDYYWYKAMFTLVGHSGNVTFIPSTGADQVPNIFAILYGWGVNPKALVDDDVQGTTAYNKIRTKILPTMDDSQLAKVISKNAGFKGVEDTLSKDEFRAFATSVVTIDDARSNHENAGSSKELLGRTLLDAVEAGDITVSSLSDETIEKINRLVEFVESA